MLSIHINLLHEILSLVLKYKELISQNYFNNTFTKNTLLLNSYKIKLCVNITISLWMCPCNR